MKDGKKKNKKKDLNKEKNLDEFYPLKPEDIPRHAYSFTNILYNNRMNYEHDVFQRKYIGQFILGKKLGQGTFGIVELGIHQITGEKVAVKILEKEKILQEADKTRIEREIKILKNMRHNNIVHLYDIKETPSSLYIIMEYISGKELFEYIISKKRLSELESCNFYQQIISGIEYLGKIRVVHRDLKPENLLLDEQKNIKIVDFGLSNIYPNNELLRTACGSPCYAAPEMINGEPYVGLRVDIWSSGIVLFAMLCGYLPFEDADNELLYKKITNGKFKAPKYLSESCLDFLHRILNVNPEKRFTIEQIKSHPWFNIINPKINMSEGLLLHTYIVPIDEKILEEMVKQLKFNEEEIRRNLIENNHNHTTTTYYLLLKKKIREGKKTIGNMKSKEFLNYLKNPINLLSTYGYNLRLIIQIRSKQNKEILDINNFDNINNKCLLSLRTQSDINMNKKQLMKLHTKQNSEEQLFFELNKKKFTNDIKIKTIYHKKNNELLKRVNYTKKGKKNFFGKEDNDINNSIQKKSNLYKNFGIHDNNAIKKNKDSTKINLKNNTISSDFNNLINTINNEDTKNEEKSLKTYNKIKEYEITFTKKKDDNINNNENLVKYENKSQEEKLERKNKKENVKGKNKDYSYFINNKDFSEKKQKKKNQIIQKNPKRTLTNFFELKNGVEKKFNFQTITERENIESNIDKKYIYKFIEQHFTGKNKNGNKDIKHGKKHTEFNINKNKFIINNTNYNTEIEKNGIIKINNIIGRMQKITHKKIKDNSKEKKEMSYENFSKEKIYYLLTERDKNRQINKKYRNGNININIKEYNNKQKEKEIHKFNFSSNNSSKLVKNLLKINSSFKFIDNNKIKIKKSFKIDKLENSERKPRILKDINQRAKNKRGFIDTSVSFDKSPNFGKEKERTKPKKFHNIQREKKKININLKNKVKKRNSLIKNEIKNIDENNSSENEKKHKEQNKIKEKDNKYLKIKAKNKKFYNHKIEEQCYLNENLNINYEKKIAKLVISENNKTNQNSIIKRNMFENTNHSIKNNTNIYKNKIEDYNTIIYENNSLHESDKEKNIKIKPKIKSLNTQENLIKRFIIRKKHLYNSLNESKKDMLIKKAININLNNKLKSHSGKSNLNDDIFYQTCINYNSKRFFPFPINIKKTIEEKKTENKNNEINKMNDDFKPFDLNFIYIKEFNSIKESLIKEIKSKKWKYKIKTHGYLIYKKDNQIKLEINRCKDNNLYIIRIIKNKGDNKIYKNMIKQIIYKLK